MDEIYCQTMKIILIKSRAGDCVRAAMGVVGSGIFVLIMWLHRLIIAEIMQSVYTENIVFVDDTTEGLWVWEKLEIPLL